MAIAEDETAELRAEAIAVTGVAHDLDNLLFTLAVRADLMERQLASGDVRGALSNIDVVRWAIDESRQLTGGLRNIVRRRVQLVGPIDLVALVEQMAPLLDAMAGETVAVERRLGKAPAVKADQLGLRRVLLNLVTNAREALGDDPGSIVISVEEVERDERDGVELRVSDTGPGMTPEVQAAVADPGAFSQAGGSGLGLATVAEVVEASDGSLSIESEPGEGCAVILWFPAARDELSAGELEDLVRGAAAAPIR